MKFDFSNFSEEAAVKYNTLLNWEKSRYEQNLHFQKTKEQSWKQSIEAKNKLMQNEKIANTQLMHFYVEHMKVYSIKLQMLFQVLQFSLYKILQRQNFSKIKVYLSFNKKNNDNNFFWFFYFG